VKGKVEVWVFLRFRFSKFFVDTEMCWNLLTYLLTWYSTAYSA